MWPALACALIAASPTGCCGPRNCVHPHVWQATRVHDSTNFHVESYAVGHDAQSVAGCCESWREHLQAQWLGVAAPAAWNPRCTVVVHARRDTYRAAIGRGGEQSFGSSWIDSQAGRVSSRRIDLLVDGRGVISALGHELTHLVLADAFPGQQPPVWANEGLALLADSVEKQQLHHRDLVHALEQQTSFHCAELLQLATYPRPERLGAFYAQSASLTSYLIEVGGTEKLIPFLRRGGEVGYDRALADTYGIGSLAELQRRWQAQARELSLAGP